MNSFTPIILIMISVGLFFFHLQPEYNRLLDIQEEKAEYDRALESAEELSEVRENLIVKKASFSQSDLERLELFIPDTFDLVRFVNDVNGIASRYNISLRNIRETKEENPPTRDLNAVTVNFTFETSHQNFMRFIRDLEASLRIMDLTSVRVRPLTDGTNLQNYEIGVRAYWIR